MGIMLGVPMLQLTPATRGLPSRKSDVQVTSRSPTRLPNQLTVGLQMLIKGRPGLTATALSLSPQPQSPTCHCSSAQHGRPCTRGSRRPRRTRGESTSSVRSRTQRRVCTRSGARSLAASASRRRHPSCRVPPNARAFALSPSLVFVHVVARLVGGPLMGDY